MYSYNQPAMNNLAMLPYFANSQGEFGGGMLQQFQQRQLLQVSPSPNTGYLLGSIINQVQSTIVKMNKNVHQTGFEIASMEKRRMDAERKKKAGFAAKLAAESGPKYPDRYKTALCRNLLVYGDCKFGSGCWFAHSVQEMRPSPPSQPGANHRSMAGGSSTHGGTCNSSRSNSALGSLLDIPFPNMMPNKNTMSIDHPLAQDFSFPTVQQNKTMNAQDYPFQNARDYSYPFLTVQPNKSTMNAPQDFPVSVQNKPMNMNISHPLAQDFPFLTVQNKTTMNMNISHPPAHKPVQHIPLFERSAPTGPKPQCRLYERTAPDRSTMPTNQEPSCSFWPPPY